MPGSRSLLSSVRARLALPLVALMAALLSPGLRAGADSYPQAWTQTASLPAEFVPRWDASVAAFPPAGQVVLFGGAPADLDQPWWNDTWIYTATTGTWAQGPAAPAGLTPRGGAAMAFDPAIGKLVLFGGAGPGDYRPLRQTWLFDGSGWTQGPWPPKAMAGRTGARMVYDDALGQLVLLGGSGATPLTDTWLFDGTRWTRGPAAPPDMEPRMFFGMTYDPGIGKVVAAGGDGDTDVWYFDGSAWTPGGAA